MSACDAGSASAAAPNPVFRKTRLCKFNMNGKCARGETCNFAHNATELQALPDFRFTKMCPSMARMGRCERGGLCTYAHCNKELRTNRGPVKAVSRRLTQLAVSDVEVLSKMAAQQVMLAPLQSPARTSQTKPRKAGRVPPAAAGRATAVQEGGFMAPPCSVVPDGQSSPEAHAATRVVQARVAPHEKVVEAPEDDCTFVVPSTWSRQSTEAVDDSLASYDSELSDSDTETDSPVPYGVHAKPQEQAVNEAPADFDSRGFPRAVEKGSDNAKQQGQASSGPACTVKNTFLHFGVHGNALRAIRRVQSTGDCTKYFF